MTGRLEPLAARMAVNALVHQTGTHAGRMMRVAVIQGSAAHCEWIHEGQWHADWFCLSGLRVAVCSDVRLTRAELESQLQGEAA